VTSSVRVTVSALLLLGAIVTIHFRSPGEAVPIRKSFSSFPAIVGAWKGRDETILEPDTVNMLKLSDYLMRRYVDRDGISVWLYIGYWQSQRRGSDIHSPKNCLPGGGWEPIETSRLSIPVAGHSRPISVNRYLVQKDNQMQLIIYWFQSRGTAIAGELGAKIELVRGAVLHNRTDGALVRLSSPVKGGVDETTARLTRYVQALYPILPEYLPE
jgi:EpsI family protein